MMTKPLAVLLAELGLKPPADLADRRVAGIVDDSRLVERDFIFVAVEGLSADGHDFLDQAATAGAVAAIGEKELDPGLPYFQVPDSRQALARLAAAWHDKPAQKLIMIGITGTDGKTTAANLLYGILQAAGQKTGMITTVHAIIGDEVQETGFHVTTPPAMQVQGYLARMVAAGMTHCIIEATSHGLAQRRVAACDFDLAVVTNITHEHLDYHGSHEAYRQAKAELFRDLDRSRHKPHGQPKVAVLNRDDSSYEFLLGQSEARQVSYGFEPEALIRGSELASTPAGVQFTIERRAGFKLPVQLSLLGQYNAWNALAAFSAAVEGLGLEPMLAARGLEGAETVPGRMEPIDLGQTFQAIVDFAHTPNALRQALKAARQRTEGRVIAIFGSAGLRDRAKRRLMAEISARLADVTILTAEDPRTESLEAILSEMAVAAEEQGALRGRSLFLEPDRGQALRRGLALAEPGDLVIACGKGHEQSMCFGTIEYPWDDRQAMRAALAEYLNLPGPAMPQLPTSPSAAT